jgi:hypothetical protein
VKYDAFCRWCGAALNINYWEAAEREQRLREFQERHAQCAPEQQEEANG